MAREYLDAVIVPNGTNDLARANGAGKTVAGHYIISGENGGRDIGDAEGHARIIYGVLMGYGIKPSEIVLETDSRNTLENILFSLAKLEDEQISAQHIGVVTSPTQLSRIRFLVDKAKQEGIINRDLELTEIPTEETFREKVYGVLAIVRDRYKMRRGIRETLKKEAGALTSLIKRIIG